MANPGNNGAHHEGSGAMSDDAPVKTAAGGGGVNQSGWQLRSRALSIAGIYAVIAYLWIYFSDQALFAMLGDTELFARWSVYKGLVFVTVTSLLLLWLMWKAFGALEGAFAAIKRSERRLSASRAQLAAVINSAMDAIVSVNADGRIVSFNPAAERMFGVYAKAVLGQPIEDLLPSGVNESCDAYQITRGVRASGDNFPIEAAVSRVRTPQGELYTAILRDISQRLAQEKALQELNETLERRVSHRTQALEIALSQAQAADRLKSAFLATMSHELRTPLNSIIGFTGIVLQELAGPLTDEQKKQLGMVRGSARHLLELINDVLDLSKIEAGELEVRPDAFNVRESVERVVASVRPMADGKKLSLNFHVDPDLDSMVSDRRRVEQILLNLLNNAIKFTDHGSVDLYAERMTDYRADNTSDVMPALRLRIVDTGMGIKEDDLRGLFRPFSQVGIGLAREHDGTGLGLAICRRLAELLGGSIFAASQKSSGSEFTVLLPLDISVAELAK
jgi:PAS domain S-box-containing protein